MPSNDRQTVLNKWLKRDFNQLKQFCAANCLEMLRAKSVEIWLMAVFLQSHCIEKWQDQDFWQV